MHEALLGGFGGLEISRARGHLFHRALAAIVVAAVAIAPYKTLVALTDDPSLAAPRNGLVKTSRAYMQEEIALDNGGLDHRAHDRVHARAVSTRCEDRELHLLPCRRIRHRERVKSR